MKVKEAITENELAGFENLLSSVKVEALAISPYASRYLTHLLQHKKYYCRIYAQLLNLALKNSIHTNKNTFCIVDYGAGNGLMGLLAKYAGFGKVFINDLSPEFLYAAKLLAEAVHINIDGFIEGDCEEVKRYFGDLLPDAIVGTDVIEHIYDLEHFFKIAKEINPAMVTVMSTACNPANYFKTREFKKLQVKDELCGGSPGDNTLFGEIALEPFIEIRRKIITNYSNGKLLTEEINSLAVTTRGLRKDAIEKAVEKYLINKTLPSVLSHPTNTCDPLTGSWSERLLSFDEYKSIYSKAGFNVEFYNGFYNEYEAGLKSKLLFFLNRLIPFSGFCISPFIILTGKPKL
jgi:2-polyprenyl-3-methyl-5-hydroxy-6-metoxy-1,4-benzoquinol methylase